MTVRTIIAIWLIFTATPQPVGAQGEAGDILSTSQPVPAQGSDDERMPNILLFLADDMTYHDAGVYGNPDVHTPHIDRLAAQGMRFTQAFNSSPMCAPTRMSLYTGIHPVRNGGHPNHSRVYDHIESMPHHLTRLGYRVALIGKRHEAPEENFPFEYLGGSHGDRSGKGLDLEMGKVLAFMEENAGRPWTLVISSNQPHTPWNRGDASAYAPDRLTLPPYLVDTPETREALARYYAEISYMDRQLGEALQYLGQTGQADETIVLFLSEQGSNFPHAKWTCYDTGLRSAAIIRWPGVVAPGAVSDALVQYVDVLPTFLDAVGADPEAHDFDGRSFLPVLTGARSNHAEFVFGVQTSRGIGAGPEAYGIRTVRSDQFRLIWNLNWENEFQNIVTRNFPPYLSWVAKAEGGDPLARWRVGAYRKRPQFELYDLRVDPFELHNIADRPEYQPVLHALKAELDAWMDQQGDLGTETEAAALERQVSHRARD